MKFRQVDRVTDVLSFPDGDINPETNRRFMGDVLICREVAEKQAEEENKPSSEAAAEDFATDNKVNMWDSIKTEPEEDLDIPPSLRMRDKNRNSK